MIIKTTYLRSLSLAARRLCITRLINWHLRCKPPPSLAPSPYSPSYKEHKHTSQNRQINRRTLQANIARPKHRPQQPGTRRIPLLLDLVAAVELRVTACLHALLNGVVALDGALVCGGVARVLALVADVLVAGAVVTGGGGLRERAGEGEGKEEEDEGGEDA
jgi:hypothetical protein